ncbi:galactose-1-phosphate uridylyltransferase [candidate division KSB1 bacterium]
MSQLRKDPILGRWVIIAEERARRPSDFTPLPDKPSNGVCPFCEGNEHMTPKEVFSYRDQGSPPNGPGWNIRVVSNKYPALRIEGDLEKRGDGIYDRMNGIGAHEVIIETPKHVISITELSDEEVAGIIKIAKERMLDLKGDKRFLYGMLFKNVGAAAGASLEHSHSQLIVLPSVPIRVKQEMHGSLEFFNYRGRCIFCDIIRHEKEQKERIVYETNKYIAISPYASRFPFEIWILPKEHMSHYENISDSDFMEISDCLKTTLTKLESTLERPPYNFMVHSSPFNTNNVEYYHWHIEITPRLTRVAGFEWGTGFYINPVAPENAAKFLREV